MRRNALRVPTALGAALLAAGVSACGMPAQNEDEPSGKFRVQVVRASFPPKQRLSQSSTLEVLVRNAGSAAVPDISLTLGQKDAKGNLRGGGTGAFSANSSQMGLASPARPVWIIDQAPADGGTAYVNTYALGRLQSGESRRFSFRVTAVKAGRYDVHYEVNAGLDGKAKAVGADGKPVLGVFHTEIQQPATSSTVDPKTGNVVRGGRAGEPRR